MGADADVYLAQLMEMGYSFETAAMAVSNTHAAGAGLRPFQLLNALVGTLAP